MATQTEPIRGKVAKILNSREVALNIGREQGVASNMVFEILSSDGDAILDPDTGASLGSVNLPKTRVKINRVDEKFSIASTYRSRRVNASGFGLFEPPKWETRYETLKSKESFESAAEPLDEWDSYVNRGDIAVQVMDAKE